ncbi:Uncharacterised protein [Yersinia mollaretii]|nr:Uncharacterised protein [Yersinia mollaretii]
MDTLTVDAARNIIVIPSPRLGTKLIHLMNINYWKYCNFLLHRYNLAG